MNRPDRFDDAHELGNELPVLPIPRPGEAWAEPAPHLAVAPHLAPPPLNGGASLTSASEREHDGDTTPEQEPAFDASIGADVSASDILEADRFTWELAAQLTSGMLANPGKVHTSVKDAMAMFDQFLHEIYAYRRLAAGFDHEIDPAAKRRRDHVEYFQGGTPSSSSTAAPAPADHGSEPTTGPPAGPPRIEPAKPRPLPGYQPLPPGARTYMPGSMAGAPPPIVEPDPGGLSEAA